MFPHNPLDAGQKAEYAPLIGHIVATPLAKAPSFGGSVVTKRSISSCVFAVVVLSLAGRALGQQIENCAPDQTGNSFFTVVSLTN
jgi:hypothetical protein